MSSGPEVTAFDKCSDLPKDSGTAVGEGVSGIAPSSFTRLGVGFLRLQLSVVANQSRGTTLSR
jgi:hypothetical protein